MRPVRPLRVFRNALVCALAVGAVWACYGPTELVVSVSTNVDCAAVQRNGVSIRTAASEGQLVDAPPATESNACEVGPRVADLGTLVLVPSGAADDDVVLQVVLGVERPTRECQPPSRIEGCIVARRRVGYVRHRSLRVPIVLDRACLGVQCGERETCERGACVSAVVQTCMGGDCELEADGSAPLPLTDGAPLDVVAPPTDLPDADVPIEASLCPARPTPPQCGECAKINQDCCITLNGPTCVAPGTCPDVGAPARRVCSDSCQCSGGETCFFGSCPIKVCGGNCFSER